jgi:phosphoribosyl-ATP pyrophosphohydrolase/phosphoribosyl-AMP cyclohydrolase
VIAEDSSQGGSSQPKERERARIAWHKGGGLVPAIVQDAASGAVLMLGYMNEAALDATLERGRIVFFSRSKQRLWEKGETSGRRLQLIDWRIDCDGDTLLLLAQPAGPVCHTGTLTCFGDQALTAATRLSFLLQLEQLIAQRRADRPEGSYTAHLFAQGPRRIAQKVGEEALEVALAAVAEPDEALLAECADLLYHLLVLLQVRSLELDELVEHLRRRHVAKTGSAPAVER